jgi:hypothetical protein
MLLLKDSITRFLKPFFTQLHLYPLLTHENNFELRLRLDFEIREYVIETSAIIVLRLVSSKNILLYTYWL